MFDIILGFDSMFVRPNLPVRVRVETIGLSLVKELCETPPGSFRKLGKPYSRFDRVLWYFVNPNILRHSIFR